MALAGCGGGRAGPAGPSEAPEVLALTLAPLPEVPIHGYYMYGAGYDLAAVAGWTNWALIYTLTPERSREVAAEARALRIRITWTPFRGETTSAKWGGTWASNKELIRPFADAGVLHSVYVADEPMATRCMTYDQLAARIAAVHSEGWKAMVVEQGGGIDARHPPVDYYGLDWYDAKRHLILRALQRHPEVTFYVGAAFSASDWPAVSQRGEADVAKAARVQLIWWMWPTVGRWVGAADDPEMQAEHRQIAASLGVTR